MIDIETLGTSSNAVILSFGAVMFDTSAYKVLSSSIFLKPDIMEQQDMGREIDENTLNWWSIQPEATQDISFSEKGRISVVEFINYVHAFCRNASHFWAKSPSFDLAIIESLFKQKNKSVPWNYWDCRDVRTILDFVDASKLKSAINTHDPVSDATMQATLVLDAIKKLNANIH